MSKNTKYEGLSWLSEEGKAHLIYLDELVQNQNLREIYELKEDSDFSTTLHQVLIKKYNEDPKSLNEVQLNLFLCMHLENSGQSSSILSCLQEWFPEHKEKFVNALREVNAPKSADVIERAIELLPKDGSWFFDTSNETTEELLAQFEREFSDYPDGSMSDLYRKYAEKNKADVIKINK